MSISLIYGLFGLIIGSFLNVLILRWGTKSLSGRSTCMSCGETLRWHDLIPVLSWLLLRGRCRDCGAAISIQYPLVEALTGTLFFFVGAAPIALPFKLLALPIAALLLAIAVYDLHTAIIPDVWVALCGLLSFAAVILGAVVADFPLAYSVLAGPLAALPLFVMWYVSGGRWMGLGDSKLALSLGWLLGIEGGIVAVFLAFVLGAIVSVPLLLFSSEYWRRFSQGCIQPHFSFWGKLSLKSGAGFTMKSEIPFGPFLVAACFLVWFAHMYGIEYALWNIAI